MDIRELVHALTRGDLLTAREFVADAQRNSFRWETVAVPSDLDDVEMAIAAAVVELLSARAGTTAPLWTHFVAGVSEPLILDPGLERMPRSFARAKSDGPEPFRRRNLVALPDFLAVA